MNRTKNNIYDSHLENKYQMALRELKNNNSNLQEKFEILSKVVEDECKDTLINIEYTYDNITIDNITIS
ncbi:MAG: hypothetical protein ACOCWM_04045 [Cyclobacteriaceae bacterium]